MMHKKLLFLTLVFAVGVNAGTEGGLIQSGSLTPASTGCEEIDSAMGAALVMANRNDNSAAVDVGTVSDTEANACLPSLENIGIMINGSVPSFSLGNLITAIRDKACKAAELALERGLDKLSVQAKTPYQLADLEISVGGGASGVRDSGKSVFDPAEQAIVKLGGELGKKAVDAILEEVPSTQGINRSIDDEMDEIGDGLDDAVDGARGGINDL